MTTLQPHEVIERTIAYINEVGIDAICDKHGATRKYVMAIQSGHRFPPKWLLSDIGIKSERRHIVTTTYVLSSQN